MKKIIFILSFIVISNSLFCQKNVVKINPLGLIFGTLPLSYERVIKPKISLQFSPTVVFISGTFDGTKSNLTGFGFEFMPKFGFGKKTELPRGWYAAPAAGYSYASGKSGNQSGSVGLFNLGGVAGYQWVFGKSDSGFALDLNAGLQYINASSSGDISSVSINGILPRIGVNIGYAF